MKEKEWSLQERKPQASIPQAFPTNTCVYARSLTLGNTPKFCQDGRKFWRKKGRTQSVLELDFERELK